MIEYELSEANRYSGEGFSSLGVESKYYADGYWYKQNISGYEGDAEAACSMILRHSNIRNYVDYEACRINGKEGCRSKNFLKSGESVVTFKRLYETAYGGDLANKVYTFREVKDRIQFVISFIGEYTGLDCTKYLRNVLSLDMLTLNIDRHFHNLALIRQGEKYRECPIFDNGAAFLSNYTVFPPDCPLEENIANAAAKPFSGSFEQQVLMLGTGIELDYEGILRDMQQIENRRIREVIAYQLKRYRSFFGKYDS